MKMKELRSRFPQIMLTLIVLLIGVDLSALHALTFPIRLVLLRSGVYFLQQFWPRIAEVTGTVTTAS